jgi:urocanate hydratase
MGGAQPLAVTTNEGVAICVDCTKPASTGVSSTATDTKAVDIDDALRLAVEARDARRLLDRVVGNAAGTPRDAAAQRSDRHRHRPDLGARPLAYRSPISTT